MSRTSDSRYRVFSSTLAQLPAWMIIAIVAILARVVTFGDPVIHIDEEFYYMTAHEMWRGALPYVDIWDRKPIGLFLLYMPAAWLPLPWGSLAYQAMATLSLILTAVLIRRLAQAAGWRAGALLGAVAYVLWPNLLNGVGGQSPIFYNLLMATTAMLIVVSERARYRRVLGFAAMALVGIALQVKYSVVFEGMFFGVWLLWREWVARRSPFLFVFYGAVMVALSIAPTIAAWLYYSLIGQSDAFVFANFISIQQRNADPLSEAARNIGILVLILSPIVAMTLGARGQAVDGDTLARRFLLAWFGAAFISLVIFRPWFDHYGIALLLPGCACAAGFFGNPRFRARTVPAILAIVAIGGQITVLINLHNRGNATQFAMLERAIGKGPGCLYVYSGSSMPYAVSGRCYVTRHLFASSLISARDGGSVGVDQSEEIARILSQKPAVVTMRPFFRGERPELHDQVMAAMARDYRLTARLPMGRDTISVYKRAGGE